MSKKLLDSGSSSSSEDEGESRDFKVNEKFADVFNKYREKEEYQKLKAKYGEKAAKAKLSQDSGSDSDSESSSEEDENAEEWTEEHEKEFFKTLANLKRKDSKIYDSKTAFFSKIQPVKLDKKSSEKPMTLGDLEREVIVQNEGEFEELADESLAEKLQDKTYVQEMQEIQSSLKKATKDDEDSDDDNDALLLSKKEKTREQVEKEEADYRAWLAGHKTHLKDSEAEKELSSLKDFWNDKNLDEGEKFLRDYILKKRYIDNRSSDDDLNDEEDLDEDEKILEKQAEFEHKYNFRFEEPDDDFIKRYPRTIQDSMRRKDESRKKKRLEIKERKLREKEVKKEELKQLKALKRKEILEKIEKLRKITGNEELAFKDEDLEGDFDPDKYDQRMNELFDQYDNEPIGPEDEEKPVFSDLEDSDLEVENWDEYDPEEQAVNEAEPDDEEENIAEETDSKAQLQTELIEASKGRKKSKKKKSKFAEKLESSKPLFDPEAHRTFEQYIDEYYGLDYEDIIGDLPCRFKYRKVPANDLGLSVEEILSAPDRELNAWASLKKTCQYRSEEEEKKDLLEYKRKGGNVNLKKKILPSLFKEDPEEELEAEREQKASKSKKRRRKKANGIETSEAKKVRLDSSSEVTQNKMNESTEGAQVNGESKSKKRRQKKKEKQLQKASVNVNVLKNVGQKKNSKKNVVNADFAISDTRLEHYGLKPSKFKRQVRKKKFREMSAKA